MLNRIVLVQECDATDDDSSTKDGYIIFLLLTQDLPTGQAG